MPRASPLVKIELAMPNEEVKKIAFRKGTTVEDVLSKFGVDINGEEIDFEGRTVNGDSKLNKSGTLTIIPSVKGGM